MLTKGLTYMCRLFLLFTILLVPVSSVASNAAEKQVIVDEITGMELVYVAGGCFQMGDTTYRQKPEHEVCVDGFYIGKYEVTQAQYHGVTGQNPSRFTKEGDFPVERVSWDDAIAFIDRLNEKSGMNYRLPTEAEWEYAAKSGGKEERYAGASHNLLELAWYEINSQETTHKVGTKAPNGLGIYDMSGNVYEWCSDWFGADYYAKSPRRNPQGPSQGKYKINRGGGWYQRQCLKDPHWCVSTEERFWSLPKFRDSSVGFRIVLPE